MKPATTRKRTLGFFLSLIMILSVLTVPVFASETTLPVVLKDGTTTVEITKTAIESAEYTDATFTYNDTTTVTARFYSVKNIFENAQIDITDIHGITAVGSDGFVTGYSLDDFKNLYLYFDKDGKINLGIDGSKGNKWPKDVVKLTLATDHVWFVKKGACKHYCSICNADEPSISLISGENTTKVYDCEIKKASSVNTTFTFGSNSVTAVFYSMKDIFETANVDMSGAHGIKAVASDGFITGYTAAQLDELYIYVDTDGTYRTAINGSAGNKWAKDVVTFEVASDHVAFVKKGACKHYCAICNESMIEKVDAKAATETAEGNIEYFKCSGCGKLFKDKDGAEEIKAEDTVIAKLKPAKPAEKKSQTLKVKVNKKKTTVTYKTKKNMTVKKAITVKGKKGEVTFKLLTKNSKIKVNKKTGTITLKKGIKFKKYLKVKILVKAAATDQYKAASKKVVVTIKMK